MSFNQWVSNNKTLTSVVTVCAAFVGIWQAVDVWNDKANDYVSSLDTPKAIFAQVEVLEKDLAEIKLDNAKKLYRSEFLRAKYEDDIEDAKSRLTLYDDVNNPNASQRLEIKSLTDLILRRTKKLSDLNET